MASEERAQRLANYVRMHRRRSGLTQRELGLIVGYGPDSPISRHERFRSLPPLAVALGYEIVFQVPVSELFAGVHEAVSISVEARLVKFEAELRERIGGEESHETMKKLKWIMERNGLR